MYKSEKRFHDMMIDKGLSLLYEPIVFRLNSGNYTPDFYCLEQNCFYEITKVKASNHTLQFAEFKLMFPQIRLKCVDPNGNLIKPTKPNIKTVGSIRRAQLSIRDKFHKQQIDDSKNKLLTLKEVAEILRRKTNKTVLELIKSRKLKSIFINERVILVRKSELDRFLEKKEKQ